MNVTIVSDTFKKIAQPVRTKNAQDEVIDVLEV